MWFGKPNQLCHLHSRAIILMYSIDYSTAVSFQPAPYCYIPGIRALDIDFTDSVQSDTRAFGIAGDWKATASKAEVWVGTVTEGGRGFMAA